MAYDTGASQYRSRQETGANRAILMVGAGTIGSVVLMFVIEKIF